MKIRENGVLRDMTPEEVSEYYESIKPSIGEQIEIIQQNLDATDHEALKHSEGEVSDEEYESLRLQRRAWREELKRLRGEL